MAIFDSIDQTTDNAITKSEEFIRNSEAYYELKVFQIVTSSLSVLIKSVMIGILSLIALMLLALALANYLETVFESTILGYVVTASLFILLALIVYGFRRNIENGVIKALSKKFFKDKSI